MPNKTANNIDRLVGGLRNNCRLSDKQQIQQDGQANNNEEDYESNYNQAEANQSGRLSSGSGESAFSSASDEECASSSSQLDLVSEDNSSSSGRSSTAHSRGDLSGDDQHVKQINTVRNLIPETEQVRALVDAVRLRILDNLKDKDEYEASDLEELRKALAEPRQQEQSQAFRWISRFFNFNQLALSSGSGSSSNRAEDVANVFEKEISEACEKLREFLLFRHQFQVARVMPDQFCKEIFLLNGIFPFGYDKQNLPILYLRARVHRRWSHKFDEAFRRYVAWQVDLITKSNSNAQVNKTIGRQAIEKDGSFGICFDCLNVSYSCVDMDFLRFLVRILVNYYPTYCRYALCVDLPWLFRSVWKLVRSWLPEDAQNTVQLITSKQLTDYISEDQIPNSIRINDLPASEKPESGKHRLPDNWDSLRSIDEMADELNVTSSEIKQFKAHLSKVLKEYQQSGAV